MKNKSLITNICTAVLSVLVIAFLALPYFVGYTGYDSFQVVSFVGGMDIGEAIVFLFPLLALILAIITLTFSIINILGNVNVIKCKGLLKASRIVNLIASVVLGALAIASLVVLLVYGATLGIGLILNLVFIVGMIATTALTLAFARKK